MKLRMYYVEETRIFYVQIKIVDRFYQEHVG